MLHPQYATLAVCCPAISDLPTDPRPSLLQTHDASGRGQADVAPRTAASSSAARPSAAELVESATARQRAERATAGGTQGGSSRVRKRASRSPPAEEGRRTSKRAARTPEKGNLSGTSTSGRTLRIRMPKAEEPPPEVRTTRSSTRKANGAREAVDRTQIGAPDSEADAAGSRGNEAQGDASASEGSDAGFEFDDDF